MKIIYESLIAIIDCLEMIIDRPQHELAIMWRMLAVEARDNQAMRQAEKWVADYLEPAKTAQKNWRYLKHLCEAGYGCKQYLHPQVFRRVLVDMGFRIDGEDVFAKYKKKLDENYLFRRREKNVL